MDLDTRLTGALALLVTACLVLGCASPVDIPDAAGSQFEVGTNQGKDPCTLYGRSAPSKIAAAGAGYFSLQCGSWDQPSGSVFVVDAGSNSPRSLISEGWWRLRLDQFARCGAARPTSILDGVEALALDCRLYSGNWPYQAVVARIGERIYLGDGIPGAFRPLEQGIGVVSGRVWSDAGPRGLSAEMRRLEGLIASANFDVGDVTQYKGLLRLGRYYNQRGQYALAERQYRKALLQAEERRPELVAFLSMHLALELSNQEKFEAAGAMFERAEATLVDATSPAIERARLDAYRSMHLANQRRNREATVEAERAKELFQLQGYVPSSVRHDLDSGREFTADSGLLIGTFGLSLIRGGPASARGNAIKPAYVKGKALLLQGRLDAAEAAFRQARGLFDADFEAPRDWVVEIDVLGAQIAEARGDLAAAQRLLNSAVASERALIGSTRAGGMAFLALGRVHARRGHERRALSAFREGFEIIGEQGGNVDLDDVLPYFQIGIRHLGGLGGGRLADELFEAAQLVTSPLVTQQIAQVYARLESGSTKVSTLLRQMQDAQARRERIRQDLDASSGAARERLKRRWDEISARIGALELEVQTASPGYNQLVLFKPIPASEVRQRLRADEALAHILIGADGGVGFLVDRDGIQVYDIGLSRAAVRRFVRALRRPVEADEIPAYPIDRAYALYRHLFGPVERAVRTKHHLITIPTGALLSLPFAMLVTDVPPVVEGLDYSAVPWMVARHALTVSPAVQSFVSLRNTPPSKAPKPFVGFGDPVPGGRTATLMSAVDMPRTSTCRRQASLIANFARLPGTAVELKKSAGALGAGPRDVVLQGAFTVPAVRRRDLTDYRYISFATHGLLPSKLECLPDAALLTTPSAGSGSSAAGLLLASEVAADLEMDADLVVLSACDTGGGGKESGGEALSGLARNFFFAGARNLLVSHWEVPSLTTLELLVRTFERLSRGGQDIANALRESQLGIIKTGSFSHPKAWAGFTLVGHGG
ncbi:CHAT domain-containing protein [Candidatus Thiosymbion oneisti]|uniref:CHAT domain-containing protein n=1 Tax=Candidatus Thiosymbion oneisti TaxID=589554 RepID=UPI0015B42D3F|nr:CHAT domain-containing tetratricopeptide repeat protein [Candidatus Thiosymbion oneisti]